MKKLVVVIFLGLLTAAVAQSQNFSGIATQEMTDEGLVAGHSSYPISSKVRVTNPDNGKEIEVTIILRLPPSPSRIIDLSPAAAKALGLGSQGRVNLSRIQQPQPPQNNDAPPPQGNPSITIVNNIGEPIIAFYIRYAGSGWRKDTFAGNASVANGQSFPLTLPNPLNAVNRYDIKLETRNSGTYTKSDVTVSAGVKIEFTIIDSDEPKEMK